MTLMNFLPPRNVARAVWELRTDLLAVVFLVGLGVAARLLPHAPNFTPLAASAVFAASVLRVRAFSLLVPVGAMMLGDAVLGFYDWRITIVVYGSLALPAAALCWSPCRRRPGMILPVLASSSIVFFLLTNLAVWAFTSMYAASAAGLAACYIAGLPFLKTMFAGDLFWGFVLFGGYGLLQRGRLPGVSISSTNTGNAVSGLARAPF